MVVDFIFTYPNRYQSQIKSASSIPGRYDVYFKQLYVIIFVKLFTEGQWFSSDTPASSAHKFDDHDITDIMLKVALH